MDQNIPPSITASDICDALGRKEMASRLERTTAAISNAASEGIFPAGWYLILSEMCAAKGIDCPAALFNFLLPVDPPAAPAPTPDEDAA
jgi:hypothetical protein